MLGEHPWAWAADVSAGRCTMPGHFDASQESGGLLDDNDHICDIHVVNMIYSRSGVCWSNLVAMASIQISIKQSGVGAPDPSPCHFIPISWLLQAEAV